MSVMPHFSYLHELQRPNNRYYEQVLSNTLNGIKPGAELDQPDYGLLTLRGYGFKRERKPAASVVILARLVVDADVEVFGGIRLVAIIDLVSAALETEMHTLNVRRREA